MITYNASDIVKRAEQLADLENSDFISFSEKREKIEDSVHSIREKFGKNSLKRGRNIK